MLNNLEVPPLAAANVTAKLKMALVCVWSHQVENLSAFPYHRLNKAVRDVRESLLATAKTREKNLLQNVERCNA